MSDSSPDRRIAEFLLKEYGEQREARGRKTQIDHLSDGQSRLETGQSRLEKGQQTVTKWIYAIFAASAVSAGASATPQIFPEQYAKLTSLIHRLVSFFS